MIHRRLDSLIHFVDMDQADDADFVVEKIDQKKMDAVLEKISKKKKPKTDYYIATRKPKKVNKKLNKIEAAGGMVVDEKDRLLLIYRDGIWDLPKGKKENDEKNKETAKREVTEETGVKKLKIKDKIDATYHWYYRGIWTLKESIWYRMEAPHQKTKPQIEEGIIKAVWCKRSEVKKHMNNMYPNIILLIEQYYL